MNLPAPTPDYDPQNEAQTRATLETEDAGNHKKGKHIEVGAGSYLILTDTVTGARMSLTLASGALTLTAL
jgi:hypothetical protein